MTVQKTKRRGRNSERGGSDRRGQEARCFGSGELIARGPASRATSPILLPRYNGRTLFIIDRESELKKEGPASQPQERMARPNYQQSGAASVRGTRPPRLRDQSL